MTTPQFVDMSQFQPSAIDWQAYKAWSSAGDGVSRVSLRSSYGNGYKDPHFDAYRQGALAAGIDSIIFYHYAYPSLNSAVAEANSQYNIVGAIRPQDILILDFEENVSQATPAWALAWLEQQEANYGGKLPGLYASSAYIASRLQDSRLAKYPLWLANWQYTTDERPPVPAPWSQYEFVQYTDRATNVPGISGSVDADIFLGVELPIGGNQPMSQVPSGWSDDGTTLKAPDGTPIKLGFRDHVLNSVWDPANIPLESEQHLTVLEQSNPSLGAGQRQLCRKTSLEYTPKNGIFEGWLGQELQWHEKQYKALQAQNADLQKQITALQAEVTTLQTQLAGNTLAQELAALQDKVAQAVKLFS